jgi:hypothetical protein
MKHRKPESQSERKKEREEFEEIKLCESML